MTIPFDLYLIRHGLAGEFGSHANDDQRPLTPEGDRKTRQVAQKLATRHLQFDHILASPRVRAHQTAEILRDAALGTTIELCPALADGDLNTWLFWLKSWQPGLHRSLALVGHEPSLSQWAEVLVFGQAIGAFQLKKAGIIGLALPDCTQPVGRSVLFWLTPPRLLLPD